MILYIDARTASIILNLHFVVSCFLSKYGILLVNFERHFINRTSVTRYILIRNMPIISLIKLHHSSLIHLSFILHHRYEVIPNEERDRSNFEFL